MNDHKKITIINNLCLRNKNIIFLGDALHSLSLLCPVMSHRGWSVTGLIATYKHTHAHTVVSHDNRVSQFSVECHCQRHLTESVRRSVSEGTSVCGVSRSLGAVA